MLEQAILDDIIRRIVEVAQPEKIILFGWELDHIIPKADGGANHLPNRALLCGPCNKEKSDKLTLGALRREIYGTRRRISIP